MQPSMLLADEILAVGDMSFQERCLQKVRELARDTGLTVLFVSHDMEAVSRICDRVIWLKDGALHRAGEPEDVVTEYQNAAWEHACRNRQAGSEGAAVMPSRYGEIVDVKLLSADGREIGSPPSGRTSTCASASGPIAPGRRRAARSICSRKGVLVFRSAQPELMWVAADTLYEALVKIPANLLSETNYTINVGVTLIRAEREEHALVVNRALAFMVYGERGERRVGQHAPDGS